MEWMHSQWINLLELFSQIDGFSDAEVTPDYVREFNPYYLAKLEQVDSLV